METLYIQEPLMVIRIDISIERSHLVQDVVYYRSKMPMNLALRWRWYFEYIAALLKVKHPRRTVRLFITKQELKTGTDYIAEKRTTLLRAKRAQIKKLQHKTASDLFGFAENERLAKINKLQEEIAALECGKFNYWFPVDYKNHIKQWI